jgi:hypothetical protein
VDDPCGRHVEHAIASLRICFVFQASHGQLHCLAQYLLGGFRTSPRYTCLATEFAMSEVSYPRPPFEVLGPVLELVEFQSSLRLPVEIFSLQQTCAVVARWWVLCNSAATPFSDNPALAARATLRISRCVRASAATW